MKPRSLIPCALLAAVILLPASLDAGHIKVWFIAGQSNAAGAIPDSQFPAEYQTPRHDVEYWRGGRLPGDGFPDYSKDREGFTDFGPLEPGNGREPNYSGPGLPFGHQIKDAFPTDDIALIKYGMGGASLLRGYRNSGGQGDWDHLGQQPGDNPYEGVRYEIFKQNAAFPALQKISDRGDTHELVGLIWLQGEADAGNATAAATYQANMQNLVDAMRAELDAPALQFYLVRLNSRLSAAYLSQVRTAMENVAAGDDNIFLINTDDLQMNADGTGLHYGGADMITLTGRVVEQYQTTLPPSATRTEWELLE